MRRATTGVAVVFVVLTIGGISFRAAQSSTTCVPSDVGALIAQRGGGVWKYSSYAPEMLRGSQSVCREGDSLQVVDKDGRRWDFRWVGRTTGHWYLTDLTVRTNPAPSWNTMLHYVSFTFSLPETRVNVFRARPPMRMQSPEGPQLSSFGFCLGANPCVHYVSLPNPRPDGTLAGQSTFGWSGTTVDEARRLSNVYIHSVIDFVESGLFD